MAIVAWLALVFTLHAATPKQRDMLAQEWAIWVQALGAAVLGWTAISILYAPYRAHREDKERGFWNGNHFIYRHPFLVATVRILEDGGRSQKRTIRFDDAEPSALAYYTIELTPKTQGRAGVHLTNMEGADELREGWITPSGEQHLGVKLSADRTVTMLAKLKADTSPVICRIWCHSFYV